MEDWHLVVLLVVSIVGFAAIMMFGVQSIGPKK